MIHVIATVNLSDGTRDQFLHEFRQVVPFVLKEDGCIEYGPATDIETNISAQAASRDNTVTIIEKWESIEALEAHLIAAHMVEYRGKVKSFVKDVDLRILQPA